MIIVFEGPDNTGKTTAALAIAKALRAVFMKVERPKAGNDLKTFCRIVEVAQAYSGTVVLDRHVAISEPIYGRIIRGKHDLNPSAVLAALTSIDLCIYCRPPTDVIKKTLKDRPQMDGVVEHTQSIIDAYDAFFDAAPYNTWDVYDFTSHSEKVLLERIQAHVT